MEEYKIRMVEEFAELYNKTVRLKKFLNSQKSCNDYMEGEAMHDQLKAMLEYLRCLMNRMVFETIEINEINLKEE